MHRMKPTARIALTALFALSLTACSQKVEDTHPDQPVTKRQEAFKAMLRTFEPMGTMLRTERFDADAFARLAQQLNTLRDQPWAHFGADTNYPPTKAKAAVWQKPDEFEAKRVRFVEATDALVAAAERRTQADARSAYEAVQNSCKACHNDFRR